MRKRKRKNNNAMGKTIGLTAVLVLCIGGLGYAALQGMGKNVADKYGCFDSTYQKQTAVLVDASEPRWNEEQGRSLRQYFEQLYTSLAFNERLSVYTTEGDMVGSVVAPRFYVCGQATSPEELEAINADGGSAGYLKKQRERLYQKILAPELDALLTDNPNAARKQNNQSPILEMIADVSRMARLEANDRFIIVSDLIQSSNTAQFCRVKNDMPPFVQFKQKRIYQRLKPQSLEGVKVEILMLLRSGYGSRSYAYCFSEEEIKNFYRDYFMDNGVAAPRFIRIREGVITR